MFWVSERNVKGLINEASQWEYKKVPFTFLDYIYGEV